MVTVPLALLSALTLLLLLFEIVISQLCGLLTFTASMVHVYAYTLESMCLSSWRFKLGTFILREMTGKPFQVGGHDISAECHLSPS